jgi:hypothetical protein
VSLLVQIKGALRLARGKEHILRAEINGVEDLLPPNFPYPERLELLRRHEESLRRSCFLTDLLNGGVSLILQGGYLIFGRIMGREPRYEYTSLCSTARDEELRWVQVTLGENRSSFVMMGVFAVDHRS